MTRPPGTKKAFRANFDIRTFDLNLLKIFDEIYSTRSVAHAADRLALSPSAVSHALRRLRARLDDPLFVRLGGSMQPTPHAVQLGQQISRLLGEFRLTLNVDQFDPSTTSHQFSIACLSYVGALFVPSLIARLEKVAPHARFRVHGINDSIVDDLESGAIDVALGNFSRVPNSMMHFELFRDRLVWVASKKNPMTGGTPSLEQIAKLKHVVPTAYNMSTEPIDAYIAKQGLERMVVQDDKGALAAAMSKSNLKRKVAVTTTDSHSAVAIVAKTNMVALILERMAQIYQRSFAIAIIEPPYIADDLIFSCLASHRLSRRAANMWLHDMIKETAKDFQ